VHRTVVDAVLDAVIIAVVVPGASVLAACLGTVETGIENGPRIRIRRQLTPVSAISRARRDEQSESEDAARHRPGHFGELDHFQALLHELRILEGLARSEAPFGSAKLAQHVTSGQTRGLPSEFSRAAAPRYGSAGLPGNTSRAIRYEPSFGRTFC
jgi:hypothetical protein